MAPVAFRVGGVEVVASPGSLLCPAGWAGVVVLGDAGIATVPVEGLICAVCEALAELPIDAVTSAERLSTASPVAEVLGPASLAYLDENDTLGFRELGSQLSVRIEEASADSPGVSHP